MITDEMLREAARESLEDYVNSLERDYDPAHPHQFSKEFEKKIDGKEITINANEELVIMGLGFIKFKNKTKVMFLKYLSMKSYSDIFLCFQALL